MTRHRIFAVILLLIPLSAGAQISPGKLARPHRTLEGLDGCVSCHPYGKTLSNDKCLSCHKEIRAVVDSSRGVHGHLDGKQCAECHSDHNGEDFQIVLFDTTKFDHRATTGFPLDGKHAGIACDSCHAWGRVAVPGVKELEGKRLHTYLGVSASCVSCHPDAHRGQFSGACSACHDAKGWKPAPFFSHDRSRYPLTGRHTKVECAGCHPASPERAKPIRYRGLEFARCESCHRDPHMKKFTRRCDECHLTAGWKEAKGDTFDHARTEFPLRGKHINVKCQACHGPAPRAVNASGEHGFHISLFKRCEDCHKDAHGGQFAARADRGTCDACHTEGGWGIILYTVESHRQSVFPLMGAHVATNCVACHKANLVRAKSTRQFTWAAPPACRVCHPDPHKGQFDREKKGCETCHGTDAWASLIFDHNKTNFPLDGKHAAARCAACHEKADPVRYAGVATACAPCHKDPHGGQFAKGGITRCEPCHDVQSWTHLRFDHVKGSRFALTGAHAQVACAPCHPTDTRGGISVVRYKPLGITCEDCHKTKPHDQNR